MRRARYDDAFGVVPLKWERGEPSQGDKRVVLVEVWRSDTQISWPEATKPRVSVVASHELWVNQEGVWMSIGYAGRLWKAEPGEVRRHAYMRNRQWNATIALDGWGEL